MIYRGKVFDFKENKKGLYSFFLEGEQIIKVFYRIDNFFAKDYDYVEVEGRCIKNDSEYSLFANSVRFINAKYNEYISEPMVKSKYSGVFDPSAIEIEQICEVLSKGNAKYIGITDNYSTHAYAALEKYSKKNNLKPIYGCEIQVFDDKYDVFHMCEQYKDKSFSELRLIIADLETNGVDSQDSEIIELGWVILDEEGIKYEHQAILKDKDDSLLHVEVTSVHNINQEFKDKYGQDRRGALKDFFEECNKPNTVLLTHRKFDIAFLDAAFKKYFNKPFATQYIDTFDLFKICFTELNSFSLHTICSHLNIVNENQHRALDDAKTTAFAVKLGIDRLGWNNSLNEIKTSKLIRFENMSTYSCVIWIKKQIGITNLNKILSIAQREYFYKYPRTPLSVLEKNREGLIIGAKLNASESELFENYFYNTTHMPQLIAKYDKLILVDPSVIRVEGIIRNSFYVEGKEFNGCYVKKESVLDFYTSLIKICPDKLMFSSMPNRIYANDYKLIAMLKNSFRFNKGIYDDKRELKSKDNIISILQDIDSYQSIIDNTERFIDEIDDINLYPEFKHILTENIDSNIENMLESKGIKKYGKVWPKVKDRALDELNVLKKNGFHQIYYLVAEMLEELKNKFHILVGSRGSVGSSFLAYILDITEVNPYAAHAFCLNCGYFTLLDADCGFDVDNTMCMCGQMLKNEGFNISFCIFAGLKAERIPDIDLNVPKDLHVDIHNFIIEYFNRQNIYCVRSGALLTLKRKNSFFYLHRYCIENNIKISQNELELMSHKASDIKLSTTQHPGGIFIFQKDSSVYDYTSLQLSSGDKTLVTHLEYKSLHNSVFKLDILAHEDPNTLNSLCIQTNINEVDIPIYDSKVISMFSSNKDLNMNFSNFYPKLSVCTAGLPEFGTLFVRNLMQETKPKSVSELVRISGLTHGTNVWANNAERIINTLHLGLKDVISVRDDIYDYLIKNGLDSTLSYEIMELVRKGQTMHNIDKWTKFKQEMEKHNIPQWYIESCSKIQYIFPRAHAVAYVIMALKIAYFKQYFPLFFYQTFFERKIDLVDYDMFLLENDALKNKVSILQDAVKEQKDKVILQILEIIYEARSRDIKVENIDLYFSDAKRFIVCNNRIYPPFSIIKGFGEKAGEALVLARTKKFCNMMEFKSYTKLPEHKILLLKKYNILSFKEIEQNTLF